jgi:hypothetical protein
MNEDEEAIGKSDYNDENNNNSQEEVVPFVSLANNISADDESIS